MIGTLWDIHLRQVRGRVRRWLRLIRQPRYLVGFLFGLAWMAWWLRPALRGDVRVEFGPLGQIGSMPPETVLILRAAAGLVIALVLTLVWIIPFGGSSLRLSEAEAHWLLPAPLTRRHVIHYALLRSQPGILVGTLLLTLFLGGGPPAMRLLLLPLYWLLLTLWDAHMKIRSLWWGRIRELSYAAAGRRVLLLALVVAGFWIPVILGLSALVQPGNWPGGAPEDFHSLLPEVVAAWSRAGNTGWADDILLAMSSMIAPVLARDPASRAFGLVIPALLLVAHHEWAVRFRTRFEEEAVARERESVARRSPFRALAGLSQRRRRQAPFRLAAAGDPSVAVLWKNMLRLGRSPWPLSLLGIAGIMAAVVVLPLPFGRALPYVATTTAGLVLVPILTIFSIFHLRNDFRTDLLHAEVMRTWPVPPARLAAAEIAGPTLGAGRRLLFALALVFAGDLGLRLVGGPGTHASSGFFPPSWSAVLGVPEPLLAIVLAATAAPPLLALCAVATAVLNAATLLFPSWVRLGNQQRGGAAQFGQNLLIFWAVFLCLAVAAVPAALLVGAVLALHWAFEVGISGWELPFLAVLGTAPLLVECGGLAMVCGRVWARLDPSAEMLSGEVA